MFETYWNTVHVWSSSLLSFVDVHYMAWLFWLFTPIIVSFLIPIVSCFLVYGSCVFLHIYRLRHRLWEAYHHSLWDGARTTLASFWDAQGLIWHGYELDGLEHIPESGPCLIVFYHGTLPVDMYYLMAKCLLHKKRLLHFVGDKFLFKIPTFRLACEVFCVTPGTVEGCVEELRNGHLLCISPGGVREALFADPSIYNTLWGSRLGFAKVALISGAPVIPMFTENCRETFRVPACGRRFFMWLYEKTRLPLVPIYGGFPVKLRTHLGPPIHTRPDYNADLNASEMRRLIKVSIEELIREYQRLPGSVILALLDRIRKPRNAIRSNCAVETQNL